MTSTKKYRKVLIVDDDDIYNFITSRILELNHLTEQIEKKMSGFSALRYLEKCTLENVPELIILDLDMPIINGVKFLEEYNRHFYSSFKDTKVLIISNTKINTQEPPYNYPFIMGFLQKPIEDEELLKLLK